MLKELKVIIPALSFLIVGCNTVMGDLGNLNPIASNNMNTDQNGYYTSKSGANKERAMRTVYVNTDVDTAAARLKRKYNFLSSDQVSQLDNGSTLGAYRSAAARSGKYAWSAQQGSYYKMGKDMSKDISLDVVATKEGANKTRLDVTFWYKPGSLDVEKSFVQIKNTAEGR